MISPADMVLFAAVVREGSFSRAARHLGITKQTASARIANLEQKLGVRLLERTTRRLRVTQSGAAYYDRCAAIAAQIDEANNEVQQLEPDPVGLLRVASPLLYGRRFLAPVVSKFLLKYPRARVELVLADRRINLIEDGLDLAIQIGRLEDSTLIATKLGAGPMHIVASPKFLARHGTPTVRELKDARCIGLSPFETWEIEGVQARLEPVLIVADHELVCDAAIAGVGVARVPAVLCRDAVREGKLRVLFGPRPAGVRNIYAVYPSRANLPARVRLFIDLLTESVEPTLPLHPPRRRATKNSRQPAAGLRH